MKKNYLSNSTESLRMFKSNFLESFSRVHFTVPLIIYVPIIGYLTTAAFLNQITLFNFLLYFILGFFVWTITEYLLHRFIFHYQPPSMIGRRLPFIFPGVHHDYLTAALRLVMPPPAIMPLAVLFYVLFALIIKNTNYLYSFFFKQKTAYEITR